MKLGILGAGQLARMMALAAYPLNIKCRFLDPSADACAAPLGTLVQAAYNDESGLQQLAQEQDCVTFEFENVPADALQSLANQVPVYPPPRALLVSQDRLTEKSLFQSLGIGTAPFVEINSVEDLREGVKQLGLPCILKTRRLGYDGKGQAVIRDISKLDSAWEQVGRVPCTLEGFVTFSREVSIISVRSRSGEIRFYPLVENVHHNGILYLSTVLISDPIQAQAEGMVRKLLNELDYVGVLVLELFQVGDELLANEFAPRVHNSGHWTIEGAQTSQFENHIRAVCGLPLGSTESRCSAAMVNIVGALPDTEAILEVSGASLHLYDKQPRSGRKIGHITICASGPDLLAERIKSITSLVPKN
ncbi:MAG: 5-(carboxyamino)imidazole ribonucleotide synthase [Gammaproteobacteria bacterium]|nr:5-(carboxyamino)imidazole ribonucleotide synthase [Gammaproteobacteria bacterium]